MGISFFLKAKFEQLNLLLDLSTSMKPSIIYKLQLWLGNLTWKLGPISDVQILVMKIYAQKMELSRQTSLIRK